MKTPVLAFWIIILALFLSVPVLVSAAPVGRVTRVEGMVDVLKPGRTVVNSVSPGDSVDVGDIYRAKTNGRAEITFFNKNVLRIARRLAYRSAGIPARATAAAR
jgi:hypothetical protein